MDNQEAAVEESRAVIVYEAFSSLHPLYLEHAHHLEHQQHLEQEDGRDLGGRSGRIDPDMEFVTDARTLSV